MERIKQAVLKVKNILTKKIVLVILAFVLLIGAGTVVILISQQKMKTGPLPAGITTKNTNAPKGVYVLTDWDEVNSIEEKTWQLPYVDGVVIRAYWKDINPQSNQYVWNDIDAQFAKAGQYKKKIKLVIAPGFYSPEWVLNAPGVETVQFRVPQGPYRAEMKPLPLPWNEPYLNLWFAFVDKVAQRYKDNPNFSYISATGPNSHNGELSLPRETGDEKKWLGLADNDKSVLKEKLLRAWYKTIDKYCESFSDKHFTISIILRSLPLTSGPELERTYKEQLINYGVSKCPTTFGIQTNGLNGVPIYPKNKESLAHWNYIKDYAGKIFVGFQTQAPGNLFPKNGSADKESIYKQTVLVNGLGQNADILELYQTNVLDPDLSSVVNTAHENLTAISANPSGLSGIYAVVPINEIGDFKTDALQEILKNPAVSGITLRERWKNLEPKDGRYDFSRIDKTIALAGKSGKNVQMILVPGLYSPEWLLKKISSCDSFTGSADCGKITTTVPYGPGNKDTAELPLAWNPIYKQEWKNFLQEVANKYNSEPRVVSVSITGPTSVSAEMSMPEENNINKWNKILGLFYAANDPHYNSNLVFVEEWRNAIDNFARIFQGKTLVLTMGSGLPNFYKGASGDAKDQIVAYFQSADVGNNFKGVQTSGMKACRNNEGGIVSVKELTVSGIRGGGQFNSSASNNPSGMGCADIDVCGREEKQFCKTNPKHTCCSLTETQALENVLGVYFNQTPYGSVYNAENGSYEMSYLQVYKDDVLFANSHTAFNQALIDAARRIDEMAKAKQVRER